MFVGELELSAVGVLGLGRLGSDIAIIASRQGHLGRHTHTDMHTKTQTDRQADRQIDRHAVRHVDRQADLQMDGEEVREYCYRSPPLVSVRSAMALDGTLSALHNQNDDSGQIDDACSEKDPRDGKLDSGGPSIRTPLLIALSAQTAYHEATVLNEFMSSVYDGQRSSHPKQSSSRDDDEAPVWVTVCKNSTPENWSDVAFWVSYTCLIVILCPFIGKVHWFIVISCSFIDELARLQMARSTHAQSMALYTSSMSLCIVHSCFYIVHSCHYSPIMSLFRACSVHPEGCVLLPE